MLVTMVDNAQMKNIAIQKESLHLGERHDDWNKLGRNCLELQTQDYVYRN